MCGFAGVIPGNGEALNKTLLLKMGNAIRHRGPDYADTWIEDEKRVGFVHQRLSIIDLSPAGHQPMVSHSGRYVVVFNGEIYNHLEIRKKVEDCYSGINWRGHSDTETLLSAMECFGVDKTISLSTGMFAFALWDKKERSLLLARDRMGEKPFYYGWNNNNFFFGSELKALMAHNEFAGEVDRNSLSLFMRYGYVPEPLTIFKGIKKVKPGTYLVLKPGDIEKRNLPGETTYWALKDVVEMGEKHPFGGSESEMIAELDKRLKAVVEKQMIADVPLGAFLSGGIDSSTIVAIMQAVSNIRVKTYTIGFESALYDEAQQAKKVAEHLGTEHTELYLTHKEALDVVPMLPEMYDEPFADASQIPTFLVAQMARRHITVSLSGDAGDELFGGYNRHFRSKQIWSKSRYMPSCLRSALSDTIKVPSVNQWNSFFGFLSNLSPASQNMRLPGEKIYKLANTLKANSPGDIYLSAVSHWLPQENVVKGAQECVINIQNPDDWPQTGLFESMMMFWDSVSYLPGDILHKVDRAAMAVSLETRIPFLDHQLVEFAWTLPLSVKIKQGGGKWILKQLLNKYLPQTLVDRPKMGFSVPIDSWLRGPLSEWAESLLSRKRLDKEGFFDAEPIHRKWSAHLKGKGNYQYQLWNVLMFQAWIEKYSNKITL